MKLSSVLLAAACLSCAGALSAQDSRVSGPSHCSDTLSAVDTVQAVFEVYVEVHRIWRSENAANPPSDYLASVASAIAAHMSLPARIDSRAFGLTADKDSSKTLAVRATEASATFEPGADGRIGNLHLSGVGSSRAMERALALAIVRSDSAGNMPALPPGRYPGERTLAATVRLRPLPETGPDTLGGVPVRSGSSPPIPAGFARVERFRLDQFVRPKARTQQVVYPTTARQQGVEDSVAMMFIVNDEGKIDLERAILLSATYVDFASAVGKALPRMRFEPAQIGLCRVSSVVSQAFVFRVAPY